MRSEQIHDSEFVETMYNKFAQEMLGMYLSEFTSKNRNIIFRVINRLTGRKWTRILEKRISRDQKLKDVEFCRLRGT